MPYARITADIEGAPYSRGGSKDFEADYETVKAAALASLHSISISRSPYIYFTKVKMKVKIKRIKEEKGLYQILFIASAAGPVGRVTVKAKGDENSIVFVLIEYHRKHGCPPTCISEIVKLIYGGIDEALEGKSVSS